MDLLGREVSGRVERGRQGELRCQFFSNFLYSLLFWISSSFERVYMLKVTIFEAFCVIGYLEDYRNLKSSYQGVRK